MYTYDVDELDHCQSELDGDCLGEVANRTDERVVTFLLKQRLYESHFVVASQASHTHKHLSLIHI